MDKAGLHITARTDTLTYGHTQMNNFRFKEWIVNLLNNIKYRYLYQYGRPIWHVRSHWPRWAFELRRRTKRKANWAPWSKIRVFGNSPAVRIAASFPFVGYVILLNAKLSDFFNIHTEFSIFNSNTPWNLLLLYFGSISVGVGAIIYAIWCPPILKRYESFPDYRNGERDLWATPRFHSIKYGEIKNLVSKDIIDGGMPGLMSSRNHRVFTDLHEMLSDPNRIDESIFKEWELRDIDTPVARTSCAFLYGFGVAVLAFLSISTFCKVTYFALGRMF